MVSLVVFQRAGKQGAEIASLHGTLQLARADRRSEVGGPQTARAFLTVGSSTPSNFVMRSGLGRVPGLRRVSLFVLLTRHLDDLAACR